MESVSHRIVNSHVRDYRIFNAVHISTISSIVAYNVICDDCSSSSSCYSVLYIASKPGSGIAVNQVVCDGCTLCLCQLNIQPVTRIISYYVVLSHSISFGVSIEGQTTAIVLDSAILECEIIAIIKVYPVITIVFNRDALSVEVRTRDVVSISPCILYCKGFFNCYIGTGFKP